MSENLTDQFGGPLGFRQTPEDIRTWRRAVYEHCEHRGFGCVWMHIHPLVGTDGLYSYSWGSSCLRDGWMEKRAEEIEDPMLRFKVQAVRWAHDRHFHLAVAQSEAFRPVILVLSPAAQRVVNESFERARAGRPTHLVRGIGRKWCEVAKSLQIIEGQ